MRLLCVLAFVAFIISPIVSAEDAPVPVEVWADRPMIDSVSMTRDGTRLAMLQRLERGGIYQVVLFDTSDIENSLTRLDTGEDAEPVDLFWANNSTLIIRFIIERNRNKEIIRLPRFLAFNVDTQVSVNLLESRTASRGASEAEQRMLALAVGSIVSRLESSDNHILMSINEGTSNNIYKIDITNGNRELVLKGNSDIAGIGFDWDGEARTAQTYDPDGPTIVFLAREKGSVEWVPVASRDARDRDRIEMLGFLDTERPNELVFLRDNPSTGFMAMYAMDVTDPGTAELILEVDDYDITGALRSPRLSDKAKMTGFIYAGSHRRGRYYNDPELGALFESIAQAFPDDNVSFVDVSDDLSTALIYTEGPTNPGTYFIIQDGRAVRVAERMLDISRDSLSETREEFAVARDGYSIPTLVTVPDGDGPFPGIVMPHGGPWARDYYGFDLWAQMLAAEGYVVVQPNFRGSTNLGQAHWQAGDNQWGLLMQDDVEDAILHFVNDGLIDRERMAIFGWSYGGFTAFSAATRDNGLFNCAAAGAGLSDVRTFRGATGQSRFLKRYQEPSVNGVSPIDHVEKVSVPMLIVHGEDDDIVPIEESRRFVNGLRQIDADYEFIEIEDMRHSPWRYEHNIAWFPQLLEFFETKCGF